MVKPKPKLKDFVPQRVNANKHSERGMRMLSQSIEKNGVIGAMTVAANGETFDGSATWETCVQTFGEEVEPIIVRSDGSRPVIHIREDLATADDPRAVELGIAANRVAEVNLSYDLDVLNEIGGEIDLSSMFYPQELESLLEGMGDSSVFASQKEEEDEDELNELLDKVDEIESRVKPGEIWQLGRHKIACADSTIERNVRGLLGDRFDDVGMVWSDCPYGMNFDPMKNRTKPFGSASALSRKPIQSIPRPPVIGDNSTDTAIAAFEICRKMVNQFWWGANYYASHLPASSCWIIWDKENSGDFADCELAWTDQKSAVRIFRHKWNGCIKASEHGEKRVHPTQKPVKLFTWCAEKYGQPGDIVFDPFLGSGISVIGCEELNDNRTVYGFELSEKYCEIILRRFSEFTGTTPELVGHLPT